MPPRNRPLHGSRYTCPPTRGQLDRAAIDVRRITHTKKLRRNARVYRNCIGSLRALGYDWQWISDVTGVPVEQLDVPLARVIPPERMLLVLRVAVHIGDRWATPENSDRTAGEIDAAKAEALRQRFYPPAAYNEVFDYVPGSIRHTVKTNIDMGPTRRLRALSHVINQGGTADDIGERVGITGRTVQRAYADVGLRITHGCGKQPSRPAVGQDELIAVIRRAVDELNRGGDGADIWKWLFEETRQYREALEYDRSLIPHEARLAERARRAKENGTAVKEAA